MITIYRRNEYEKIIFNVNAFIVFRTLSGVYSTEVREETIRPFERVYQDGDVVIMVDTKTNVMYTFVNNGHGGTALTVILNADGTPRIYEGEFED